MVSIVTRKTDTRLDLCPEYFKTVDVASALQTRYPTLTELESMELAVKIRQNNIRREAVYRQKKSPSK